MIGIAIGFAANRIPVRFAARTAGGAIAGARRGAAGGIALKRRSAFSLQPTPWEGRSPGEDRRVGVIFTAGESSARPRLARLAETPSRGAQLGYRCPEKSAT